MTNEQESTSIQGVPDTDMGKGCSTLVPAARCPLRALHVAASSPDSARCFCSATHRSWGLVPQSPNSTFPDRVWTILSVWAGIQQVVTGGGGGDSLGWDRGAPRVVQQGCF